MEFKSGIENYEEFCEKLHTEGEYDEKTFSSMKEFYLSHNEEYDLREDVLTALEDSKGDGLRDTQLMSLLSAPSNQGVGGDKVEEDCDIGSEGYYTI